MAETTEGWQASVFYSMWLFVWLAWNSSWYSVLRVAGFFTWWLASSRAHVPRNQTSCKAPSVLISEVMALLKQVIKGEDYTKGMNTRNHNSLGGNLSYKYSGLGTLAPTPNLIWEIENAFSCQMRIFITVLIDFLLPHPFPHVYKFLSLIFQLRGPHNWSLACMLS